MSSATEEPAHVGRVPASPVRFGLGEWVAVFRRTFQQFMKDDAMGLAQQVAYSSLLAFFPAMIFLIGLLDLIDAYDALKEFLGPVAPAQVIETIETLQRNTGQKKGASVTAFVVGAAGAAWAASGAMNSVMKAVNRAYSRIETRPFWKTRAIALFLVGLTGLVTAAMFLLIVFGGPLGEAIAAKAGLGGAFNWLWGIVRWPLAFVTVLLFFAIVYYLAPNQDVRHWKWISPGSLVGGVLWLVLSGLFALYTSQERRGRRRPRRGDRVRPVESGPPRLLRPPERMAVDVDRRRRR